MRRRGAPYPGGHSVIGILLFEMVTLNWHHQVNHNASFTVDKREDEYLKTSYNDVEYENVVKQGHIKRKYYQELTPNV